VARGQSISFARIPRLSRHNDNSRDHHHHPTRVPDSRAKVSLDIGFANSVTSPSFLPTGTLTVLNGNTTLGSGTVTNSHASFNLPTPYPTASAHTLPVNYSGDNAHATATGTVTFTVSPASSTTTLQSNSNPVVYGKPIKFTVQITPTVDPSTPALISSGPGTITLSGLPGGPSLSRHRPLQRFRSKRCHRPRRYRNQNLPAWNQHRLRNLLRQQQPTW